MAEARPFSVLNDKINTLHQTLDLHDQELHAIHQKLDAITSMLQTLSQTVQGLTKAGNQWRQKPTSPERPLSPSHPETSLATIPRAVKLEFPRFSGENPSGWVCKAHQFFQLYGTPPNQKILLASYHMEEKALIWFQEAEEASQFTSWEAFMRSLHVRFGTLAYDDPMETLTSKDEARTWN